MTVIWGRMNSVNVQKVVFAAGEVGLAYERREAGGPFGVVNTPEYRAMNPNGLIPVLEDEGLVLWESNAIVRYLGARYGQGTLWAQDAGQRAMADRWMDWQQTVFNLSLGRRTFRPSMFGKIATATYIVTGVAALYFNYLNQPSQLVQALIYASLAITFISAGHYAVQVARMGH